MNTMNMIKNISYTAALIVTALFASCQKYDIEPNANPAKKATGDNVIEFAYSMPDFAEAMTRAGSVAEISLLQFDAGGSFLGRSAATDMQGNSFKAKISGHTRVIHFIAGYDWSSFDERSLLGKSETEMIPAMESDYLVYWDRKEISDFNAPPTANLIRNQIKISVELSPELKEEIRLGKVFTLEGFTVYNYAHKGTVSPFYPREANPFQQLQDTPTIAAGVNMPGTNSTPENNDPKFIFEGENSYYNHTSVILHAGDATKKYYRIQLIDPDFEFYPVVRNTHFKIIIKDFIPGSIGSNSLNEALGAIPINNMYAEIIKESGTISDGTHQLIIEPLTHILPNPGTGAATQRFSVPVQYIKNGILSNNEVRTPKVILDEDNIISNLNFDPATGMLSADVKIINTGQKSAEIRVVAGALVRIVKVISCEKYSFEPASITEGNVRWWSKDLTFNIPATIPASYFPLECVIKAKYLTPMASSKNSVVIDDGPDGTVMFTYKATAPGTHTIHFQNSIDHGGEIVTIEHPIFHTAYVGPDVMFLSVNGHYVPYLKNCVGYAVGQEAYLDVYVSEKVIKANAGSYRLGFKSTHLDPDQTGIEAGADETFYYRVTEPGFQSVKFKAKSIISRDLGEKTTDDANHTSTTTPEKTVTMYGQGGEALTQVYEYYLTEYRVVNKRCSRSNQGTEITSGRTVRAYSPFVTTSNGGTVSSSGEITAYRPSGATASRREFFIANGARLDHDIRLTVSGTGISSHNKAQYTVRELIGGLRHDNCIYFVDYWNNGY